VKKSQRRAFLKQSIAACSGAALVTHTSLFGAEQKDSEVNDTLKLIHSMRTIHGNFNEQNIPDDQLEQILKASIQAANASNMQTYSIITIKARDQMQELCGYRGSCMLVYCVDYNRLKDCAKFLGHNFFMNNITAFVTGTMNTSFAAQTAVIAAKSMGIDSLLTNGIHRGDIDRVWKILELPQENCFPLIALVLGYPTEEPAYDKGRLDGAGIFHNESYHRLTDEELDGVIKRYDDKNAHIALNEDWETQGHKHYLDWLCKSWLRGIDTPTIEETQILKRLKRSGFVEGVSN